MDLDGRTSSDAHWFGFRGDRIPARLEEEAAGYQATAKKPVEDTVLDVSVTIPVLINTVPIQCGGELLLFKAKALPRPRALQPIMLQALTKNLRQAKASAAAAASSKVASAASS